MAPGAGVQVRDQRVLADAENDGVADLRRVAVQERIVADEGAIQPGDA